MSALNNRRHTQKVICYLMLHHSIMGCTDLKDGGQILKYCEELLMKELDVVKRTKTLRNADATIRKMFDLVKEHSGADIIAATCSTLNILHNERGYEIFAEEEPIADVFDSIVAQVELSSTSEKITAEWLKILSNYF